MIKLRILLTLAVAACAVAVTAAPASAFFHSSAYPAKEHAKGGKQIFAIPGVEVECSEVHLFSTGQAKEDSSQQKLASTFTNCKTVTPSAPATVKTGQCQFNFHQAKTALEGTVSVECPAGESITIEASAITGCTLSVGSTNNQNLKKWTGANVGTKGVKRVVEATTAATGITATVSAACEAAGLKNTKEATYNGTATFESQKDVDGGLLEFELV